MPTWNDATGEWVASDGTRFSVRPYGGSDHSIMSYAVSIRGGQAGSDASGAEVYATESDAKEAALRLAEEHQQDLGGPPQ